MIDQYTKCLILLILVGSSVCFAATPFTPRHPDPVHESWCWRSFPELKGQGLSCLVQDGDGIFLFGTDKGIYRYDGMNWHLFPFDEGWWGRRSTRFMSLGMEVFMWGLTGVLVVSRTGYGNGYFHQILFTVM